MKPDDEVNLLNEICDDPDNEDSDYGRGFAEGRRQAAAGAWPELAEILTDHYLAAMVCDHRDRLDNPQCACSRVHLGWHPSVGAAVQAWVAHVMAMAKDAGADHA